MLIKILITCDLVNSGMSLTLFSCNSVDLSCCVAVFVLLFIGFLLFSCEFTHSAILYLCELS
jgi:hypothetical protein